MAFQQSAKIFEQKVLTKILSNVTAATIDKHWDNGRELTYLVMAVATGATAPVLKKFMSNSKNLFPNDEEQAVISSDSAVDIYVYANSEESGNTDKAWLIISADV